MNKRAALQKNTRRIAIFRALQLGDLIQAVPALRAIRAGFPDTEITLIGLPWARSFVQRFSRYVDRFVEFVGFPGIAELEVIPERTTCFIEEQRRYGYDLAIQMHGSGRTSNRFVSSLGARTSVGYFPVATPLAGVPRSPAISFANQDGTPAWGDATGLSSLTLGAPYPDDQPEVYRNLGLARLLGCPDCDPRLEFPLDESDYAEANSLLESLSGMATARVATTIDDNEQRASYGSGDRKGRHARSRPLVGLHVGARPPARRWPAAYFVTLADEMVRLFDAQIILTGGTDELSTIRSVEEQMATRPINLAGKTSLGGLAALIDGLDLFISNDTGPAHIANAVGTHSITIFGPADYRRWAPLDQSLHRIVRHPVACSPCGYWDCPIDHRCLRKVFPGHVIEIAGDLLLKGAVV